MVDDRQMSAASMAVAVQSLPGIIEKHATVRTRCVVHDSSSICARLLEVLEGEIRHLGLIFPLLLDHQWHEETGSSVRIEKIHILTFVISDRIRNGLHKVRTWILQNIPLSHREYVSFFPPTKIRASFLCHSRVRAR